MTNELTELYVRKGKAVIALFMFLALVVLTVLSITPIVVAALIGTVGLVLGSSIGENV